MLNNARLLELAFAPRRSGNRERVSAILEADPDAVSSDIAKELNITPAGVRKIRRQLGNTASAGGGPGRGQKPKVIGGWPKVDEDALLARIAEGVLAAALAEEFRCHLSTIHRIAHANGVTLAHAPHGPKPGSNKRSLEIRSAVAKMLADDPQATTKEIAETIHSTISVVQRHRLALGLAIPKAKPRPTKTKSVGRHFECSTCSAEFPFDCLTPFCENGARCTVRLVR